MRIGVMMGAKFGNNLCYEEAATRLGELIAERGHSLIFGGGGSGLMWAVSNAAHDNGATVIGIIPHFIQNFEPVTENNTVTLYCTTMAERKQMFWNNVDAVVVLPGGVGTMDEFWEVLCLKHLQKVHEDVPIVILNTNHFYDKMISFLNDLTVEGFVTPDIYKHYAVSSTPEAALDFIEEVGNDEYKY